MDYKMHGLHGTDIFIGVNASLPHLAKAIIIIQVREMYQWSDNGKKYAMCNTIGIYCARSHASHKLTNSWIYRKWCCILRNLSHVRKMANLSFKHVTCGHFLGSWRQMRATFVHIWRVSHHLLVAVVYAALGLPDGMLTPVYWRSITVGLCFAPLP